MSHQIKKKSIVFISTKNCQRNTSSKTVSKLELQLYVYQIFKTICILEKKGMIYDAQPLFLSVKLYITLSS